jgi:6-phosphofructokinase 2
MLEAETLRHRHLPIKGWTRENFTATEEATGSQYPFVLRGPTLSEKEWQRGLDLLETEAEQNAAAMELIETRGCEAVVVSLGERGALLASREGCERFASPDVEVQSRVGAGDSMVAGISLALSRGESLREAVRFGVAVGAATVMKPGTELCRREDAERLFRQMTTGTEAR